MFEDTGARHLVSVFDEERSIFMLEASWDVSKCHAKMEIPDKKHS